MNKIICILLLQLTFVGLAFSGPVKIILDTDMDSDIDDVSAMALLHHFSNLSEVEILATISSSSDPNSIRVVDAINTAFNRPDIPVAIPKKEAPKHSWILRGDILSKEFSHTANIENSVAASALYRKTLAAQPDCSVVIISLGYLTNLKDLLLSEADEYSLLSGKELVAQKVKSYYCLGGRYPADELPKNFRAGNIRPDAFSASYVANHWPTPLVFVGAGDFAGSIRNGNSLKRFPENNIIRRAYELVKGDISKDWSHGAGDQLAVWIAVRGKEPYFSKTKYGYNEINEYGRNIWKTDFDKPKQSYISNLTVGAMLDSVFSQISFNIVKRYEPNWGSLNKAQVPEWFNESVFLMDENCTTHGLHAGFSADMAEVYFTQKGNSLYAICPTWPGKELVLNRVVPSKNAKITMLEVGEKLKWRVKNNNLHIKVPQLTIDKLPCQFAWTFQIENFN